MAVNLRHALGIPSVQTIIKNRRRKFIDNLPNDKRFTIVLSVMTFNYVLLVQRAGNCQVSNPASDVLSTGFGSGVDIQCILVIIIITAIDTLGVHSTSARQILLWPWQKDFPQFRGSQRGELSLSAMLSAGAAFQRSFTSQQFAGL